MKTSFIPANYFEREQGLALLICFSTWIFVCIALVVYLAGSFKFALFLALFVIAGGVIGAMREPRRLPAAVMINCGVIPVLLTPLWLTIGGIVVEIGIVLMATGLAVQSAGTGVCLIRLIRLKNAAASTRTTAGTELRAQNP